MNILPDAKSWRDAVRNLITFKYLDDAELDRLLGFGSILEFGLDEVIVQEGEIEHQFFGILQGTVGVSVHENEGKDVFICSLGAGDVFGEAGFFLNIKRTASVISLGKTIALRLNREDIAALIRESPSAGNKILLTTIYGLLRKLRAANQELAYERKSDMNQDDIDDLVGGLLEQISEKK